MRSGQINCKSVRTCDFHFMGCQLSPYVWVYADVYRILRSRFHRQILANIYGLGAKVIESSPLQLLIRIASKPICSHCIPPQGSGADPETPPSCLPVVAPHPGSSWRNDSSSSKRHAACFAQHGKLTAGRNLAVRKAGAPRASWIY